MIWRLQRESFLEDQHLLAVCSTVSVFLVTESVPFSHVRNSPAGAASESAAEVISSLMLTEMEKNKVLVNFLFFYLRLAQSCFL